MRLKHLCFPPAVYTHERYSTTRTAIFSGCRVFHGAQLSAEPARQPLLVCETQFMEFMDTYVLQCVILAIRSALHGVTHHQKNSMGVAVRAHTRSDRDSEIH